MYVCADENPESNQLVICPDWGKVRPDPTKIQTLGERNGIPGLSIFYVKIYTCVYIYIYTYIHACIYIYIEREREIYSVCFSSCLDHSGFSRIQTSRSSSWRPSDSILFAPFRIPHFKPHLRRALFSFVPFLPSAAEEGGCYTPKYHMYVSPLVSIILGFPAYRLHARARGGHRIAFCSPLFAPRTSNYICGGHCFHLCHSCRPLPKKGDATLQNTTAGGQKFCLLALKGEMQHLIPLESYQVCLSHGIWRIGFLSSVYLVWYI